MLNLPAGSGSDGPYWQGQIRVADDALRSLEEQLESASASNVAAATLAGEFSVRVKVLEEQLEAAREHLRETVDTVIWMSGSDDFAPSGKAGDEWVRRRELLYKALTFLSLGEASSPAISPKEPS